MHARILSITTTALLCWSPLTTHAIEVPVDECGTVRRLAACTYFETDDGDAWFLPLSVGLPLVGQHGRLTGMLELSCISPCPIAHGCIVSSTFVTVCEQPPQCPADFDGSGSLGVQDLFEFLGAYFGGTLGPSPPGGDFDQSGAISVQDIFEFLEAWFGECP